MIVDKINSYLSGQEYSLNEHIRYEIEKLSGAMFKRQFMSNEKRDNRGTISLSSIGKCPRQLAYGYHGIEKNGKEIDSRAKIIFWTGDLIEFTIVGLAKLAGVTLIATGLQQVAVNFKLNEKVLKGHPDGIVVGDKLRLLEIKSMSSYGFKKFEAGEIDPSYLAQINCYMEALGLDECIFVALSKDSGVLGERIVRKDPAIVHKCRLNALKVVESTPERLPAQPPEYGANDKGFYTWNCLYCAYYKTCRPNAEKVLINKSYKLKEKKEK